MEIKKMRTAFIIVAIILFVLAALSVAPIGPVSYLPLGLAFFAAASLV